MRAGTFGGGRVRLAPHELVRAPLTQADDYTPVRADEGARVPYTLTDTGRDMIAGAGSRYELTNLGRTLVAGDAQWDAVAGSRRGPATRLAVVRGARP